MFINISRQYGLTFVDVQALLQQAAKTSNSPFQSRLIDQYAMR
jgi:hypothetical protein